MLVFNLSQTICVKEFFQYRKLLFELSMNETLHVDAITTCILQLSSSLGHNDYTVKNTKIKEFNFWRKNFEMKYITTKSHIRGYILSQFNQEEMVQIST